MFNSNLLVMFLFCVLDLVGICIDYLENLEISSRKFGNLSRRFPLSFPTTFLTSSWKFLTSCSVPHAPAFGGLFVSQWQCTEQNRMLWNFNRKLGNFNTKLGKSFGNWNEICESPRKISKFPRRFIFQIFKIIDENSNQI